MLAAREAGPTQAARRRLMALAWRRHRRALTEAVEASAGKSITATAGLAARPQPTALQKAEGTGQHHHPRTLPEGREVPVEELVSLGATAAARATAAAPTLT